MKSGVLYKTRCLSIGAMERARTDGFSFRRKVFEELTPLGITCINHYLNPVICTLNEGDNDMFSTLQTYRDTEQYHEIAKYKQIRLNDLALIDKCDFVICQLDMEKLSCGTWEELFTANSEKKPILIYCEQGKKSIPLWLWWTLPANYIYNSLDEVIVMIKAINSSEVKIDSDRWKLLQPELR